MKRFRATDRFEIRGRGTIFNLEPGWHYDIHPGDRVVLNYRDECDFECRVTALELAERSCGAAPVIGVRVSDLKRVPVSESRSSKRRTNNKIKFKDGTSLELEDAVQDFVSTLGEGEKNAITFSEIAHLLEVVDKDDRSYPSLRRLRWVAVRAGHPVLTCHRGVFMAKDRGEVESALTRERNRVEGTLKNIEGLEKLLAKL